MSNSTQRNRNHSKFEIIFIYYISAVPRTIRKRKLRIPKLAFHLKNKAEGAQPRYDAVYIIITVISHMHTTSTKFIEDSQNYVLHSEY